MSVGHLDVDLTRLRPTTPHALVDDTERTGEMPARRRRVKHASATRRPASTLDDTAPVAVLTKDAALAEALRCVVAAPHRIATASSLDEAIELAAAGRCGILITDQIETQPVMRRMMLRLREREPALVVIAVGNSSDQAALIALLSAGVADRLMLKPVTPALAQIVLKSAAEQYRASKLAAASTSAAPRTPADLSEPELVLALPEPQPAPAGERPRESPLRWIAVIAVAVAIIVGVFAWLTTRNAGIDAQTRVQTNPIAASPTPEPTLEARAERFATAAATAIAKGEIAAAIVAIENLRRLQPDHVRLAALASELVSAQERYAAALPRRQSGAASAPREQPAKTSPAPAVAASKVRPEIVSPPPQVERAEPFREASEPDTQQAPVLDAPAPDAAPSVVTLAAAQTTDRAQPIPDDFSPTEIEPAAPEAAPPEQLPVETQPTPRLARLVRPKYPQQALLSGAEGWVNVSLLVTPSGAVLDPRIEESSNGQLFDRAALAAVRKWRYEPYVAHGSGATQRVTVRVDFRLQDRRTR